MSVLVLDESHPTARKEHFCQVCLGTIGVGDTYMRQRNVGDDGPYVFKAHGLCWRLSIAIAREAGMWTDEGEWPEPSEVRDAVVGWFDWTATKREPADSLDIEAPGHPGRTPSSVQQPPVDP